MRASKREFPRFPAAWPFFSRRWKKLKRWRRTKYGGGGGERGMKKRQSPRRNSNGKNVDGQGSFRSGRRFESHSEPRSHSGHAWSGLETSGSSCFLITRLVLSRAEVRNRRWTGEIPCKFPFPPSITFSRFDNLFSFRLSASNFGPIFGEDGG